MLDETRAILVLTLLALTIGVRLVAHHEAGGLLRDQADGMAREGGTVVAVVLRLVFLVGGLGGTVAWALSPELLPGSLAVPGWAAWLGVASAVAGLVLLVWVHIALGVHFSGTLHLRDGHRLVQHGPYARVRHPMYTSFLLLLGGLSVVMGNVPLAVVLLGSQVWVLWFRLPAEEASLAAAFPEAWPAYRARTGALLPRW